MRLMILTTLALVSVTLSGCKRAAIEGQVVDAFGKPVSDAMVSVSGTQFSARTDGNGNYSVGYVPGSITVAVAKPGFTDTSFSATIATESTFPAASVRLYEIPQAPGIFLVAGDKYRPLGRAAVTQQTQSYTDFFTSTEETVFSIEYEDFSSIPVLKTQNLPFVFVDSDPSNQSLFQIVRSDGCNCLLTRILRNGDMGFAMNDYSDDAKIVNEAYSFKTGLTVRTASLSPGIYAFAPYSRQSRTPILAGAIYVVRVENP